MRFLEYMDVDVFLCMFFPPDVSSKVWVTTTKMSKVWTKQGKIQAAAYY